jgi:hypothetical protein
MAGRRIGVALCQKNNADFHIGLFYVDSRNIMRSSAVGAPQQMPAVDKLRLLARDLRARAEQVLAQAKTMQSADVREKMRRIATSYEELAQRLEKQASGDK